MRIVTLNKRGTAHLAPGTDDIVKLQTLCGYQIQFRSDLTYPQDGKLHLCGRCQKVVENRWYKRRYVVHG